MDDLDTITRQEAADYCPGRWVELTTHPGQVDCIVEYDPFMVPPIWLRNDPMPRYPHELRILARSPVTAQTPQRQVAPVARSRRAVKAQSSVSLHR